MARVGTWLVTGGCGFIGKNLVASLVRQGKPNVRVVDNLSNGTVEDLTRWVPGEWQVCDDDAAAALPASGLQLIVGDLRDPALCEKAVGGCEQIVHLAAMPSVPDSIRDPQTDFEHSAVITFNVLNAARKAGGPRKVVIASSSAAVGSAGVPVSEDCIPAPMSPYGAGKLTCEGYGLAFASSYHMNISSLRFSNVYGPGSSKKDSLVAKLLSQLTGGLPLTIHGDGRQTRDFIFIDDLVAGIVAVIDNSTGGEIFQVGTGSETSVQDIALQLKDLWARMTGLDATVVHVPERAGDVKRNYSNIDKIRAAVGWEPQTPLVEGLSRTTEWWLAEHPCRT